MPPEVIKARPQTSALSLFPPQGTHPMYPLTLQHLIVDALVISELSLNVLIDCSHLFGIEISGFFFLYR